MIGKNVQVNSSPKLITTTPPPYVPPLTIRLLRVTNVLVLKITKKKTAKSLVFYTKKGSCSLRHSQVE